MKTNELKNSKAITLIAMVVTIIVLLILAGVSIAVLTGENGILNRATSAKQTNEQKTAEEELRLGISALTIDYRKNTTNAKSFREYVMDNGQALANAMGVNQNEITMEPETYTVTYKGQMYIVEADGSLSSYRLIELTGFNIKETTLSIQEGRTKKLTIENRTPNGANEGIVWTSSDPTIASVDANGVVTGVKQSATTVTITATSKSGNAISSTSCVVTVTEATSEIEEGRTDRVTYGKYVNYNVDLGIDGDFDSTDEGTADDWRVFYDDGENIYIIAADYVPNSNPTLQGAVSRMGATATGTYGVFWSSNTAFKTYKTGSSATAANGAADIFTNRPAGTAYLEGKGFLGYWKSAMNGTMSTGANARLTASLMDTKIWEGFAGGTLPSGVSGTAYAIGGPTLSMFVESWNKIKTTQLYYNRASSTGYYVKAGSQPLTNNYDVDLSSNTDYTNASEGDLYFPRKSSISSCSGYWLASPLSFANSTNYGMGVYFYGQVAFNVSSGINKINGVRPVVCLPSGIGLKTGTNGNYDITNNQWDE